MGGVNAGKGALAAGDKVLPLGYGVAVVYRFAAHLSPAFCGVFCFQPLFLSGGLTALKPSIEV